MGTGTFVYRSKELKSIEVVLYVVSLLPNLNFKKILDSDIFKMGWTVEHDRKSGNDGDAAIHSYWRKLLPLFLQI